jgi:nucleoside-diphosphate-sugar epimerase
MLNRPEKVVVTGAAGFIGSHLCERLLADGHQVVGIDCFTDHYERSLKESNLTTSLASKSFTFSELDLVEAGDALGEAVTGAKVVFHLAGQPAVRPSWGVHFDRYVRDNIIATQRLLECLRVVPVARLVFGGSSSVYGDAEMFPTKETALPRPLSPYGVTKLGAEHLTHVYMRNFGIQSVSVRYFTVYGPRQRPDMAFSRFMEALASGEEIEVFGDGEQTREFTYVSDIVEASLLAAGAAESGIVLNVGGGARLTVNAVVRLLGEITGRQIQVEHDGRQPGDIEHTLADLSRAAEVLGFRPRVSIDEGLAAELEWLERSFSRGTLA